MAGRWLPPSRRCAFCRRDRRSGDSGRLRSCQNRIQERSSPPGGSPGAVALPFRDTSPGAPPPHLLRMPFAAPNNEPPDPLEIRLLRPQGQVAIPHHLPARVHEPQLRVRPQPLPGRTRRPMGWRNRVGLHLPTGQTRQISDNQHQENGVRLQPAEIGPTQCSSITMLGVIRVCLNLPTLLRIEPH
jgi:hypothetical protein